MLVKLRWCFIGSQKQVGTSKVCGDGELRGDDRWAKPAKAGYETANLRVRLSQFYFQ